MLPKIVSPTANGCNPPAALVLIAYNKFAVPIISKSKTNFLFSDPPLTSICIFGEVTGGHFNPAVTIGVLVAEGMENFGQNIGYAIMIIIAQIIGAFLGCCSSFLA